MRLATSRAIIPNNAGLLVRMTNRSGRFKMKIVSPVAISGSGSTMGAVFGR
jgi:hypothetical protein